MKVVQRGHRYEISQRKGDGAGMADDPAYVQFVNRENGQETDGTISQELLRVIIDHTFYCNNCLPHRVNEQIIHHLRMALVLHESRALEQQVYKGEIEPEKIKTSIRNGHFELVESLPDKLAERELSPVIFPATQLCNHRSGDL